VRLRMLRYVLIAVVAGAIGAAGAAGQADAAGPPPGFTPVSVQAAGHHAADNTPVLCRQREWEFLRSGLVAYNDVYGPHYSECLRVRPSGFRITRARTGSTWGAFPDVFLGCEYGVCSRTALPQQPVRDISALSMTLYTRFHSLVGNDSTDWWFDRGRPGRSLNHPNGAEVMVWLAWRGVGMGSGYYLRLAGQTWYVEHWLAAYRHLHWQYIQLRWISPHSQPSVRLNMLPVLRYLERVGWLRPSWYPSSLDAGFEIVHGGIGDRILKYQVRIRDAARHRVAAAAGPPAAATTLAPPPAATSQPADPPEVTGPGCGPGAPWRPRPGLRSRTGPGPAPGHRGPGTRPRVPAARARPRCTGTGAGRA
jgi:hypothetical protein